MAIKDEYRDIKHRWQNGLSNADLYALIVTWLSKYKSIIRAPSLPHLINRLCTDEIEYIINDFIFGEMYADLRNEMR